MGAAQKQPLPTDAEIAEVKQVLLENLRTNPPDGVSSWALATWFAKVLTPKQFDVMEKIENLYGPSGANEWLCDVLEESGAYTRDGDRVQRASI